MEEDTLVICAAVWYLRCRQTDPSKVNTLELTGRAGSDESWRCVQEINTSLSSCNDDVTTLLSSEKSYEPDEEHLPRASTARTRKSKYKCLATTIIIIIITNPSIIHAHTAAAEASSCQHSPHRSPSFFVGEVKLPNKVFSLNSQVHQKETATGFAF
ncbi:hypothetical protein ABVT39_026464 [Epinephelus coioides]